ncbi:hypothetical protein L1987_04597 [Smallanthus sonchifolius]|uniref:Uncharacterized protein n=1 Tax=Smallanthus sonchifolius TaxID=185202 RepID=A0ACB9JT65_9ASTR|nr:hypothetical protein L1987_04597 [Smallanthus sonchifolius]
MRNNICYKFLHLVLSILPLFLLWLKITTANPLGRQLIAVGRGVSNYKCIDEEMPSLLYFKAYIHEDPYNYLSTWTPKEEEATSDWSGVTCNNQGHVTGLYLRFLGFKELGNLTNLQILSLENLSSCTIENLDWLSYMSHLEELHMDGISLAKADNWVNVILNLQNLSTLSVDRCELSQVKHPYVNSNSSSIASLYLQNNNLNSSMYHWLFPLTSNRLVDLRLSGNNIFIPAVFGLSNNQFNGTLSPKLVNLDISANSLKGAISANIGKSTILYIDLSNNSLEGVLSGAQMSNLSFVEFIHLSSCKLGPRFPKWIKTLKRLTHIDISNTRISDTIPEEFWNMGPSQLTYLNLSSNNITGKVTNLTSNFNSEFSILDLSSNNVCGHILNVPSTLQILDLSENKFYGEISFLCQIVDESLFFLDLSHNSFTGQIPDWL